MGGGFAPDLQDALPNVPDESQGTPDCYLTPAAAMANLTTRYGLSSNLVYGHLLTASMRCDEEGPFQGVKIDPEQEREWPRTFKYGWPNIIAAPSAMLVSTTYPGAWYLNYEGVVPQQIVDWVCLEAWKLTNLPFDRMTTAESVTGASVHYAEGGSMLQETMGSLIRPFLLRQARTQPFQNYLTM
jgi:hypothetical protein